jgi:hypothetical protein
VSEEWVERIGLIRLMKDFLDENEKWPKFTYGDMVGSSMVYVYHQRIILAFLSEKNVVVRSKGHYFGYCGSPVPMFDRFIPEHPEFIAQVSNAIDTGIWLIEYGKPWYTDD